MCGIVGICGKLSNQNLAWLDYANNLLHHRGPDSFGKWICPNYNVALGHRRLSIIDTSDNSNQPFVSKDGSLVIVFNGEIYNYIELRDELRNFGYKFRTNGDTEVLLIAYEHWGFDFLSYLNGMWAFAIYDQRNGKGKEFLFISRDRAGEKPLYYSYKDNFFEFASEIKAIKSDGEIDLRSLNHYLALGFIPGNLSILKNIKKLPAAHAGIYELKSKKFKVWKYWEPPQYDYFSRNKLTAQELSDHSWSLIKKSVSLRMRSEVPYGIFLSGGLDSSLITAAAAQLSNERIKTFTIGFPGSKLDETSHANIVAKAFNTEQHILEIEEPSIDVLDELEGFIDEPLADSSIIPSFLISKMTKQHVTVALGGDGGDEIFGGYEHYQNAIRAQSLLGWIPKFVFKKLSKLSTVLPIGFKGKNFLGSLQNGPLQTSLIGSSFFDISLRKNLFHPDVINELGDNLYEPELKSVEIFNKWEDPVQSLTRLDFQQVLPDDYLTKIDRTSMINSLEVRSPFLDKNLIEYAFKYIPSNLKTNFSERRIIQNLIAKKQLPNNFKINRKQGFSIPLNLWMRNTSLEKIIDKKFHQYFNINFINNLIIGQNQNRSNGPRLFSLMMLKLAKC